MRGKEREGEGGLSGNESEWRGAGERERKRKCERGVKEGRKE